MARTNRARRDMATLVLNVYVGARERWKQLTIRDQQALVAHMRTIANSIELSIGMEECK